MRRRWPATLLLLALHPGRPLVAQAPDISRVVLGRDSVGIVLTQNGQARPLGAAWDELTRLPGAPPRLKRIYRMENTVFGALLDTVIVDLPSLRTYWRHTIGKLNSDSLGVVGDSVFGWVSTQKTSRAPEARWLPPGTIDASFFDVAIRGTDWGPAVTRSWQAYLPSSGILTLTATYDSVETVQQLDGTMVECWRIQADFAGSAVTFWVDPRTRAMVKQTLELSRGAAMVLLR